MTMSEALDTNQVRAVKDAVCAVVCNWFIVSRRALLQGRARKGPSSPTHARQVAMYLTNMRGGISLEQVGAIFGGRSRSTVQHACALIEDARDDELFDALLDELEDAVNRRLQVPLP